MASNIMFTNNCKGRNIGLIYARHRMCSRTVARVRADLEDSVAEVLAYYTEESKALPDE